MCAALAAPRRASSARLLSISPACVHYDRGRAFNASRRQGCARPSRKGGKGSVCSAVMIRSASPSRCHLGGFCRPRPALMRLTGRPLRMRSRGAFFSFQGAGASSRASFPGLSYVRRGGLKTESGAAGALSPLPIFHFQFSRYTGEYNRCCAILQYYKSTLGQYANIRQMLIYCAIPQNRGGGSACGGRHLPGAVAGSVARSAAFPGLLWAVSHNSASEAVKRHSGQNTRPQRQGWERGNTPPGFPRIPPAGLPAGIQQGQGFGRLHGANARLLRGISGRASPGICSPSPGIVHPVRVIHYLPTNIIGN